MSTIVSRLWNLSPASLTRAVQRRLRERRRVPGWFTVRAGPAAGMELFLPHGEDGAWLEMVTGEFDAFIYKALRGVKALAGATVWDIGAHIGYHSLSFAAQGARVLAFEPNQFNASALRKHMERNPKVGERIKLLTVAMSDTDGETTFVQSSDLAGASSGSHLVNATTPLEAESYRTFERSVVKTFRMDTLIANGEPTPDVLKIDIEGAEMLALKGGLNVLQRIRPVLLIEVHHICLMMQIQALLSSLGYVTRILDPEHATPSRCFIIGEPPGANATDR